MKTYKLNFIFALFAPLFFSFTTGKDEVFKDKVAEVKSIALVSTMIGSMVQPVLPFLDAGPFNRKTNSIAPLIIEQEVNDINNFRESVALSIKNQFNCEVIYGNTLISKPEYNEISGKYNFPENLKTRSASFPTIIIPADEKNLFQFSGGNAVNFLTDKNIVTQMSEICKSMNTDYVAVSYSSLTVVSFGMFGGHGNISLITYLFIYDKEGKLVADVNKLSKALKVVGNDVAEYKFVLNSLPEVLPKVLEKVSKEVVGR